MIDNPRKGVVYQGSRAVNLLILAPCIREFLADNFPNGIKITWIDAPYAVSVNVPLV